jgi:hypothetical protein
MARIAAEALRDPVDIFLASSVGLARAVEALLTSRGINYVVQVEFLGRTTLFGSQRYAAAFYVSSDQASYCRSLLREADLAYGIVEE